MSNWKEIILKPDDSIERAIQILEKSKEKVILVADEEEKLIGTLTDGDIRRALIQHKDMDTHINEVMCKEPVFVSEKEDKKTILKIMKKNEVLQIPILDSDRRILGLEILDDLLKDNIKLNPVILMAGGFGKRLKELTKDTPKPLLKIGKKPILEMIIEQLASSGFVNFFISTHYMAEMIHEYFGDGEKWGINISYLDEQKPLGTAGALALLPKDLPNHPLIVMNGDLLTKINMELLLKFHLKQRSKATICVTKHDIEVPFGVINHDYQEVISIDEKPTHSFFINAGIYVLDASLVNEIKVIKHMDMTEFLENQINQGSKVRIFPAHEYWIDIGRIDEYETANNSIEKWNL